MNIFANRNSLCKMYLVVLFCLVHFSRGFDVPELKYNLLFDSPIYAYGEESAEHIDTSKVVVERYNESVALMYGYIEFKKGMGTQTIMEIILQKEASGKFEVMFSHDICDLCAELADEESDYKKYLQYFGIPSECPIDAGSYEIKNFVVDSDDMELSSQHTGRYEAQLKMYERTGDNCQKDRTLLFTLKIDMIVEPE